MFLGEYQHSVDGKGRIVLPSKMRAGLEEGLVVTKGQDRCLSLFSKDQWEIEVAELTRHRRENRVTRNYARTFFSAATEQVPDKQGRIQLPQGLRDYAGLGKDVVVIGVGERAEVWDTAAWTALSAEADDLFSDIEEALPGEGM